VPTGRRAPIPVSDFFNTGIQQAKAFFHQQMGLQIEEGKNEILHLVFLWC
jgi:hypothetical protein